MQNPKEGDKCGIFNCNKVWTIKSIRKGLLTSPRYLLEVDEEGGSTSVWLNRESFFTLPPDYKPKKPSVTNPLTWIKIKKTKLTTPYLYEEPGVLKSLIYSAHDNTINYELIQEDGSWKHFTIILPDSAEVVIGRTVN